MADQETAAAALKAARDAVRALGKTEAQIERIVATGKYERATRRKSVKWARPGHPPHEHARAGRRPEG
jgi:hypothetical protein